ncbi:exported hypothetical protein [Desulfamplus magnetovallimortis]|uniref:DUF4878 domain-containing protein n=1 Tax=Desulfamplus magnetovallimortis TaxID=1246637 RepID=A0A1W1HBV4_9BACT|nr:hypothetical protein [Desulfamplus magnetovallimortis]SLM29981.1 exported hypothetical protein [Desulfamplus magnetovallimortis]
MFNKLMNLWLFAVVLLSLISPQQQLRADTANRNSSYSDFQIDFTSTVDNVPDALLKNIMEYWNFKGQLQFEKTYAFEAPHTKYQFSMEKYLNIHQKARKLNEVLLLNVEELFDIADIRVKIFFSDDDHSDINYQIINERWILLHGKWCHVFRNPMLNIY